MEAKKQIALGFIGFGELASGIARGLIRKERLEKIWAYDQLLGSGSESEETLRKVAAEEGVGLAETPERLVKQVEIIISSVVPAQALRVAQAFSPLLSRGQIYADFNSCAPQMKIEADREIAPSGASYVDVGVVGGISLQGHKIPCLACGPAAERLKALVSPWGMNIRVVAGPIGTAARMKMLRSVALKGIEALMLEMLTAAKEYGLEEEMMSSVAETFDRGNFRGYLNMLMTTHAIAAGRRLSEVEMVAETVKESGVSPFMSEGMIKLFAHSAGLDLGKDFHGNVPSDYKEVTSAIIAHYKKER